MSYFISFFLFFILIKAKFKKGKTKEYAVEVAFETIAKEGSFGACIGHTNSVKSIISDI